MYTEILEHYSYPMVMLLLTAAFIVLYFGMTIPSYLLFAWTVKQGFSEYIVDKERMFPKQIKYEIRQSLVSIFVFGLYGLLLVYAYRNNIVEIGFENNWKIFPHFLLLIIWNEIHFYACHALMHTKTLLRFHRIHHKSYVVTPFSTYSFHPVESVMLGSVMIIPMLAFKFEIISLILLPVYHLAFNILGHSNIRIKRPTESWTAISSRHNSHHTKFHISLGFVVPYIDRLFKSNNKDNSTSKK